MNLRLKTLLSTIKQSLLDPDNTHKKQVAMNLIQQGYDFSQSIRHNRNPGLTHESRENNPLESYFNADGHKLIWKWLHYFNIYHHHLAPFRGNKPALLEVGVHGGGSLQMWQAYFSEGSQIIGVDINEDCQRFASDNISIHIGDQSDRQFWRNFAAQTPGLDIVIDDGGHKPVQQIVTLEECLPLLNPGGVYICEDVHGIDNYFLDYIHGFSKSINAYGSAREYIVEANSLQQHVHSINIYPFMVVIKINPETVTEFVARNRGEDL